MPMIDFLFSQITAMLKVEKNTDGQHVLKLKTNDGINIVFSIKAEDVGKLLTWRNEKWFSGKNIFETLYTEGFTEVLEKSLGNLQTKRLFLRKEGDLFVATLFLYPEICAWSTGGVELRNLEVFSLPAEVIQNWEDYQEYLKEQQGE